MKCKYLFVFHLISKTNRDGALEKGIDLKCNMLCSHGRVPDMKGVFVILCCVYCKQLNIFCMGSLNKHVHNN